MNEQPYKPIRLKARDRAYFTANMALLLRAAVPLGEIFASLKETSRSRRFIKALDQMQRDVDEGMPLWKVLERSRIVSQQTLALVRLGEESGNLARNLQIAAMQEEKQNVLRSKILSALLYPAFVFGVTIMVGLGVAWFLLPRLAETFSQLHVPLPLISQIVINIGSFLGQNGVWFVPLVVVVLALLVYILFANRHTRALGSQLLSRTPGISRLLQEIEVARFGYLLGTLLQAGLSVTESLRLLQEAAATPSYKRFYGYLYQSFDDGFNMQSSLKKYKNSSRLLPSAVQQIVIAGERSGNLPEALLNVGTIYEAKSDTTTQNLESILEPILLVIVWLGVLIVAVAVILPIYSLVGGLQ